MSKYRVLALCDDPVTLTYVKKALLEHFSVEMSSYSEPQTRRQLPDLLIAVPGDEPDFLRVFRHIGAPPHLPVIILSESHGPEAECAALDAGAADFLPVPFSGPVLASRVTARIRAYRSRVPIFWISGGGRVLVAEDVEINRMIIADLLSDFDVEFAENGQIALSKFRENPSAWALILMDVHMPVMDGRRAAKAIRSLNCPEARSVPVVAMTADDSEDDIRLCLSAGMNSSVRKPFDPEELVALVSGFVTGKAENI